MEHPETSFLLHFPRFRSVLEWTPWTSARLLAPRAGVSIWWADGRLLVKRALGWAGGRGRTLACLLLACAAVTLLLMRNDLALLDMIRHEGNGTVTHLVCESARFLSYWGDFLCFNVLVFGSLGAAAILHRSLFLRRVLIASVISTMVCGGMANVCRLMTGRGRPAYPEEAGFHGPSFRSRRQSFPSAHTATAFGAAVPVAVALPPVGVPLLIVSAGVSWSRMQNNRHHPSDVFVSLCLTVLVGLPLGIVVRRMRRVELQRRRLTTTTSVQLDLAPLNPTT
jgi:membrane-associated phospholipid phosphatase